MHPFHAEIHARTELDGRWRDAARQRAIADTTPSRVERTGTLLVAVGERFAAVGRRLQGARRSPAAACLDAC